MAPRGADLLRPLVRALLGLEDEARLLVEVHLPDRTLLPLVDDQRIALEGVTVALGVARGRVGARYADEVAEVEQERVLVRALGRAGGGPLRGERLDVDEGIVLSAARGRHKNGAEVSEAVERYDPSRQAAILLEVASGYQVLILSPEGYDYVGGLTFEGYGLLGPFSL